MHFFTKGDMYPWMWLYIRSDCRTDPVTVIGHDTPIIFGDHVIYPFLELLDLCSAFSFEIIPNIFLV